MLGGRPTSIIRYVINQINGRTVWGLAGEGSIGVVWRSEYRYDRTKIIVMNVKTNAERF
jgi:hypothetical protein